MVLIADSGSTKTQWCLVSEGIIIEQCITKGINPFYQNSTDILKNLKEEYTLNNTKPQEINFYGAGCANDEKNNIVRKALSEFFQVEAITINSDLVGAARSLCQHQKGIACILGTGSNSCLYDGRDVIHNVSPLGYVIGDEGSGAVLGKKLMGDLLKNQLPEHVIDLFFKNYNTNRAEILDNIYKKTFPNRYLAQFTKFLSENIHVKELEDIVLDAFEEFVKRNLLQYADIDKLKVHFTGSVAFYFRAQLEKALYKYNLNIGEICQAPMPGLIQYHTDRTN
ncbi:ATPase [Carboxylicivirga marina]|uniref:ATPase n=1 Tax=Carboxylicivirga marina TaxID=2800988 RepID=A0ABS1HGC9_9BACT|nr:ATPase [Carboxylicivirga marina]MBK3516730.1 ATPase [Carboxylicivirga marina]